MAFFDKKTAVILFNLGGPDQPAAVRPFLFNLFNDKAIIGLPQPLRFIFAKLVSKKRAKFLTEIYQKIGGKSPLLDITISQACALEKELSFSSGNFKVFVAMRYWQPFIKDVMKNIAEYKPDEIILLPLYPQFSSTTTGSFVKNFAQEFLKYDCRAKVKAVCCYPEEPEFIKSHSILIKQSVMQLYEKKLEDFRFLFSAHGLPKSLINRGDPYVFHVEKTSTAVVKNLKEIFAVENIDFHICYQSKVGPLEWTSPSLEHELRRAALDKKIPIVVPISFVSDHSETLYELDIEYKEIAQKLGIAYYLRVPALNIEGHFIKNLANICQKVAKNDESQCFSGTRPERICPKNFKLCPNDCA